MRAELRKARSADQEHSSDGGGAEIALDAELPPAELGDERGYSLEELKRLIADCGAKDLTHTQQRQLGELIYLLPKIKEGWLYDRLSGSLWSRYRAHFVVRQILYASNNELLIDKVLLSLRHPFMRLSPPLKVFFGLGILIYILLAFSMPILFGLIGVEVADENQTFADTLGIPIVPILAAALLGALGSVVSMMIRINDFQYLRNEDPYIPFLIGIFKPIIGASFALFIYAAIESGIIEIGLVETKLYFILALSFVSGFSERFARDVIARVEGPEASTKSNSDQRSALYGSKREHM